MKVNQIVNEMTSGCVASIAMPIGAAKKRTTETTSVPGLKPAEKVSSKSKKKGPYANSLIAEGKMKDLSMDLGSGKDGLSNEDFKKKYGKSKEEMRKTLKKKPQQEKPVQEAKLDEDDLILIPGQGMARRTGFVKHDPDKAEHEGQTLKNSLHTIIRVATHLNKELSTQDNFPEWVSEKIGAIKHMMVTVMDYVISDKEMRGRVTSNETGGVIAGGGVGESIAETGSYNPLDQERQEQNAMDWSKRQFKNNELQGELGHEDNPNFDRNRNRGPFYIKINGKILRTRGEIKVFDFKNGAKNYALAILKRKPELKGKVFITNSPKDDEQGVEEGRFTVNARTGARLHPRTGVELPKKEKPLTMKKMFSKGDDREPEFDVDLDDVWREFTIAASNVAPDIEPYEDIRFAQWLKNHGITGFKIGDVLDAAAKKHGYDSWSDYSDSIRQYARDNVAEGLEETEETAVINMFEKLVNQGRDPIDMIAHKFGWGSYELDQLAKNLGFKGDDKLKLSPSAEWANAVKQGKGVNEGVAEGTNNIAALIQKLEDMQEMIYQMQPGFKQRQLIHKRDNLEAKIEAMPGGKEALQHWASEYEKSFKMEGVAEGSGDKVHLKTPKHGLADHPGRNTGVGLRTFAQTPEQDRCPKCNSLFKNHYKQGVTEGGILKSIKRGLQGWDKNAVGPGGEKLGDPKDIVNRAKAMDTDTAKKVRAGLDAASDHSPAGLQKRVLDRKLKGVGEGAKVDRMVKRIKKSEIKTGKSKDEAEDIAWATANKRGYLDNKNKKSHK